MSPLLVLCTTRGNEKSATGTKRDGYPASPCADAYRRGLKRIAATLDSVPFVTMCNLANLDVALRGGLVDLIALRLMCVGAGPTMDYADATAFLAKFEPLIEKARSRMLQ